ncbi:hypothetical protein HYDPIDRAFT_187630 [Hydnomerulius pinastri MD-312]|uniref:Uncharacterized protein n=1 Tax=Hydnomerulius pinastri MD-312 TaxID=994086 RepID=A0A0C9VGQ0_9AGAM|nr:hypothetical protein HYDPIDRAFT_187630 [Hydnomerulius pinastri MD-312]
MKSALILSVAVASAVCPAFAAPTPLSPQTNWKRGELSGDVNAIVKAAVQDGLVPANVGAALAQLVNDTAPGLAVLFGDLLSDSNTNSTKPSKRGLSSIGDLAKLTAQQIEALIRNNKLTPQQVEALRKGSNNKGRSLAAELDRAMARRDDDDISDYEDPEDINSTEPSKRGLSSIGDLAKLTAQQIEALIRNNKLTPQQVEALRKGSNNKGRSLAAEFDLAMARRDDDAISDYEDPEEPSKRGLSSIGDLAKLTAQQIEALIRNNKLTPQQVEALRNGSNNKGRSLAAEFDRVGTMARRDHNAIPDHEDPEDILEMPGDDEPLDKRYTSWRPPSHSHSHNHSSSAHTPSSHQTPAYQPKSGHHSVGTMARRDDDVISDHKDPEDILEMPSDDKLLDRRYMSRRPPSHSHTHSHSSPARTPSPSHTPAHHKLPHPSHTPSKSHGHHAPSSSASAGPRSGHHSVRDLLAQLKARDMELD